jgi:hypothetical protein
LGYRRGAEKMEEEARGQSRVSGSLHGDLQLEDKEPQNQGACEGGSFPWKEGAVRTGDATKEEN